MGRPLVSNPAVDQMTAPYVVGVGTIRPGVTRRDFEYGIVLNKETSESQTIDLGGTYRKLTGKQDPTVNDGSEVTSVTLPAYDGLILLNDRRAG